MVLGGREDRARGVSLLLVEDEAQARNMMTKVVAAKYPGLTQYLAENGAIGLELYRKHRPEIVVTDISMPVMDGLKMAREIKELNREVVITAVTAHSDSAFLLKAIEIGINHYLLKPIDHRQFFALLDSIIDDVLLKRLVADQNEYIRKLSRAVEQSQSIVMITGRHGELEYVNPKFCEFSGCSAEEVIGRVDRAFGAEETPSEVLEGVWDSVNAGLDWRGELISRKKDGEICHELATISPIKDDAGAVVSVVAVKQDITAAKRQEAQIQGLKNFLADIINSMPSILVGLDQGQVVTQWNRQAETATGLPASAALGRPFGEVLPEFDVTLQELRAQVEADNGPRSVERLEVQRAEERHFFDVMLYPLSYQDDGGWVLKIEDVTERVRTQELVLQTEKMASLGRLAFGMAHEVNNPLHSITQAARNIERRLSEPLPPNLEVASELGIPMEKLQAYFEKRQVSKFTDIIREAASHAASIVNTILRLSHAEKAPLEPASPVEVAERALDAAARSLEVSRKGYFQRVQVVRKYEEQLPEVPMVAVEIEQVLVSLFVNAAQAMADAAGREPRLTVRLWKNAEHLVMEVEDNGPGMPEDVRQQVFEPFFSTREVGEGIGLGLSVSFWIVTQIHKGLMTVQSEPGSGTRVTVRLPLAVEALAH